MNTVRRVQIGSLTLGGTAPVLVQGMTKTRTADYPATLRQLRRLEKAGAELVRLAVKDESDIAAFGRLKQKAAVPLIADIHFRSDLALAAIEVGADKIRINPGNISEPAKLKRIIQQAKEAGTAIRLGVNAGSLPTSFLPSLPNPEALAEGMVATALAYLKPFEAEGFTNLVVSLKASSALVTILANRLFRQKSGYPLHIGVTEAGRGSPAVVKSALGIGILLAEGIGETIRVSLSAPPEEEVRVAREILQALGQRQFYPEIIACPTCGRCRVNLFKILREVERGVKKLPGYPQRYAGMKIAVMGCEVNGPGEAAGADLGIACGPKLGTLFIAGQAVARIPEQDLASSLLAEITKRRREK